ncbi:Uncharacterized protein FWK35_00034882, partial [Aphis craccivora]
MMQNCNISDNLLNPNFKENLNNSSTSIICDKLRHWILQYKISHYGVYSLLGILRSEGIKVPKDENIDGLPITKSSKSQLWPILISVLNFNRILSENVIPIGIIHGYKKPCSIEEYLNSFYAMLRLRVFYL